MDRNQYHDIFITLAWDAWHKLPLSLMMIILCQLDIHLQTSIVEASHIAEDYSNTSRHCLSQVRTDEYTFAAHALARFRVVYESFF